MEEKDIKDLSFEEALARLENLVRELEITPDGETKLSELDKLEN